MRTGVTKTTLGKWECVVMLVNTAVKEMCTFIVVGGLSVCKLYRRQCDSIYCSFIFLVLFDLVIPLVEIFFSLLNTSQVTKLCVLAEPYEISGFVHL